MYEFTENIFTHSKFILSLFSVTFIHIGKGKRLLMFKDYTYNKHYGQKYSTRWRCSKNVSKSCKASLVLSDSGYVVKEYGKHNHDPDQYYCNEQGVYIKL